MGPADLIINPDMTSVLLVALPVLAFVGALMLIVPDISPRRYFFSVTVPAGFAVSEPGRAILRFYHLGVVADVAVAAAVMFLIRGAQPRLVPLAALLVPFVGGVAQFLAARAQARRFAVDSGVREADLSTVAEDSPRLLISALPAFVFPMVAALYLQAHWEQLPARIPVHFDWNGQPNRWVGKTPGSVYGILAGDAALLLLVLLTGLAIYYGSRRLPSRTLVLKVVIAISYYVSIILSGTTLVPILGFSPLWILIPTPIFLIAVVIWLYKRVRDPALPSEVTPDHCWYLGAFYVNPEDAAIFVQRRIGFGYTINLGNRLSWLFLAALAITIALLQYFLR